MNNAWLSILPPIITIAIAIWSKKVLPSLLAGLLVGSYLLNPSLIGGIETAIDKNKFIGAKIKEARELLGKSQKDLADVLNFESATAVSLIESGERKLKVEDLEKLANFLGQDIKFFLGQAEEKPMDLKIALRADKTLNVKDKEAILRFIELAKKNENRK